MDDAKLVMVQSFESQQAADMAASALESAGIEFMIQADSAGGLRPHIAWATGGFKLLVREEDLTAATEALTPNPAL
jgi:hypothetical protein